jgi:hypothetical protein
MSSSYVSTIISAISIIVGSLLGAFCSWIINKKMHNQKMQEEYKLIEENRRYEDGYRAKEVCNNANVIRLDIANAVFQSIRSLQNTDEKKKYLYLLPINRNYSQAVASLSDKYDLKELSYLYQLYGIIEKVNRDIYSWTIGDKDAYDKVKTGFETILYKLYGDNLNKVLTINPDKISYIEMYKNDFTIKPYKNLLKKLDELCLLENLLKEKTEENIKK